MVETEAAPELGALELVQREIEHWRRERPQGHSAPQWGLALTSGVLTSGPFPTHAECSGFVAGSRPARMRPS